MLNQICAALLLLCGLLTAQAQTFPCPASTDEVAEAIPTLAGGYSAIDLDDNSQLDLVTLANASFVEWLAQEDNSTICSGEVNSVLDYGIEIISACSQVVAGTNYALQYLAQVDCRYDITDDDTALATDRLVMDAIVYVPLPTGGDTSPQVQQVYPDADADA